MSEIEKMYKNAGVEKEVIPCPAKYYGYNCTRNNWDDEDCSCDIEGHPPFTAEKQIELIKYFSNNYNISINKENNIFRLLFINKDGVHNFYTSGIDFAEQLALFVISRYKNQILTEEEKQQVKGILG